MEEPKSAEQIEQKLAEFERLRAESVAKIDWDEIKRQENSFNASVIEAAKKYYEAGLGEPMRLTVHRCWPQRALDYPGGPVAVYEEAIRRGVTWEEVCGYPRLRYGVGYWD